jgi:hypothetical protein
MVVHRRAGAGPSDMTRVVGHGAFCYEARLRVLSATLMSTCCSSTSKVEISIQIPGSPGETNS